MLPTMLRRGYNSPSIFDEFFKDSAYPRFFEWNDSKTNCDVPEVNVEETEKEYSIELSAPGYTKEDLKISVDGGVLTIASERDENKEEEARNYIRHEFEYSAFKRSFKLPEETNTEKISAKYQNGILSVNIPKAQVKVEKAKEVKIS